MKQLSLEEYFNKLQKEHNRTPRCLIRKWEDEEVRVVKATIKTAVKKAGYIGQLIPSSGSTNPVLGSASEKFFVEQVNPHLKNAIESPTGCGGGYPDRVIHIKGRRYCMELKATKSWEKRDSHRRVLTCSPDKLLKLVENEKVDDPPAHLMGTVLYNKEQKTVTGFRVDFFEPSTMVNFRLEASTTQKMLSEESCKPLIIK